MTRLKNGTLLTLHPFDKVSWISFSCTTGN